MQEVANAAKLGVATLYRYYNTKLALVIAIGARRWNDYCAQIRKLQEEKNSDAMTAAEELDFYIDFYIDLYENHKDLLIFNQNFNNYVQHEGATPEQMKPYLNAIAEVSVFFHKMYEKGKKDKTIKTDMGEEKMFAATSHIMLAVAVRYAQGLVYTPGGKADQTEEILLLKKMILKEFVVK